jgi:hypothetical protein
MRASAVSGIARRRRAPARRSARPTRARRAAHHDRRAPVRLDHRAGRHAFELRAQLVLHVGHGQPGAAGGLRIHLHLQVFHAVAGLGQHVLRARHFSSAAAMRSARLPRCADQGRTA